ncbi:MAG: GNAT family N-acetyltransferase [Oscillospiraceae bacterium]|nr:GNAT family N-acetyltransferase [Oscillospiraceae bacterium]
MLQEDGMVHALALLSAKEDDRIDVHESISKLNAVYDQLISGKEKLYDGILVHFVVSEEARGLGIGKKLLKKLRDYFIYKDVKSMYVVTDDECNFGFYEHNGFKKIGEKELTYHYSDGDEKVNVFLYDCDLSS